MSLLKDFKDYLILLFLVLFVVAAISLYFTYNSNIQKKIEIERLELNQDALNDTVKHYVSKSGKQVATIEQLSYNVKELKEYQKDNLAVIKDLGLRIGQVESTIKLGIVTIIKDTIPIRDTVIEGYTVKCFKKIDNYLKLLGCTRGDSAEIDIAHTDTVDNVAHWTYKKWFIFKFKTNTIRLESVNRSPYSSIFFSEFIKVRK